jgi:hypothetical protein
MGGATGNLRTQRAQSGSNGSRTLGSILASDSGNGAGSVRRMYSWYTRNGSPEQFYKTVFEIKYGQFRNRAQWFLGGLNAIN